MTVAQRIKAARKAKFQYANGGAYVAGIPQQTWAAYEAGSAEPTASRLKIIAKALGVSSDWLLGLSRRKRIR